MGEERSQYIQNSPPMRAGSLISISLVGFRVVGKQKKKRAEQERREKEEKKSSN